MVELVVLEEIVTVNEAVAQADSETCVIGIRILSDKNHLGCVSLADGEVCTVGRHSSCQIVVQQKDVSRFHARIEIKDGRYILIDQDSANGTFVNRERLLLPHRLQTGDEIGLGTAASVLRFYDPDDNTVVGGEQEWLEYQIPTMSFSLRGHPVDLSINQFRLLSFLYRHAGEVCTREQCAEVIWGPAYDPDQLANLDETLNKLRRKLVKALPNADSETRELIRKRMITTRPGLGYILFLSPPQEAEHSQV